MIHRPDPRQPQPLYDVTATRCLEEAALAHGTPHVLMERAGAACARLAMALAPHAQRVWVACGTGNNGGDGLEAAAQLKRLGRAVTVCFGGQADNLPSDARWALERAREAGVRFDPGPPGDLQPHDLCIDALLGIGGAHRAPPAWMQAALQALHQAPCAVLAVDVPSGLDASSGRHADGFAAPGPVRGPRHTLSLLTLKPGLFTGQGRDAAGTVWFDDLGIDASWFALVPPTAWLTGEPRTPVRSHASHKGSFGDVAVLGGESLRRRGMGMAGAALLAGSAALHAGAGRVLVALLDGGLALGVDLRQPELMMRTPAMLELEHGAVVCGCGGGEAVREHLPRVLHEARRLVLDADALNIVAAERSLQDMLRKRADLGHATVLTPHPLEAGRLLGIDAPAVQADRLEAARHLAARFACVVLVKGSGTVLAAPGLTPCINPSGNGRLATAGTGDVLAGMLGAALAGCHPKAQPSLEQVLHAARDTVWRHGALADRWPDATPLTAGALARQRAG